MATKKFKDLAMGAMFEFAAEATNALVVPGPWVRLSTRTYTHLWREGTKHHVGSIDTEVCEVNSNGQLIESGQENA